MMYSEEDDDAADDDVNSEVLNNRLDFIQDIITDQDLYEILSVPVHGQISFSSIDITMPAPEIHLPESNPPVDVPMPFSEIHSPVSSPQWTNDIEDFESPIFDRPMTVRKKYPNRSQPKDYFMDMCPEEALDLIVKNTNIYAEAKHSRHWIDITKTELSAYFGIIILMSVNPLSD
ncbi:unnamed protein product [Parnassius apollo]|uniref:(apollo) hypothetical protein n=1 Tax=Parnassius apollo TaxID=110799 RepID=A0A8S3X4W9_PARAO|nr:unnamed protein product [Parnassius apollo]